MKKIITKNTETNTFPSVIHANGISKIPTKWNLKAVRRNDEVTNNYNTWEVILDKLNNLKVEPKPLRDDLTLVTWKGGKYKNVNTMLELCCKKFGVEIMVLPWPDHISDFWEGSKSKVYLTLDAIKNNKINTKYMMALDASDVVFLKHPNEVLEDYIKMFGDEYDSVWCTEANNWPHKDLPKWVSNEILDDYITKVSNNDNEMKKQHGSRFAYINAGCAIGRTESFEEFFQTSYDLFMNVRTNDQAMSRISQFIHRERHIGDYNCKIFQCLYDVNLNTLNISDKSE